MGLKGRYMMSRNYFIGVSFDEKVGQKPFTICHDCDTLHTEIFFYQTFSFMFGFLWPGNE